MGKITTVRLNLIDQRVGSLGPHGIATGQSVTVLWTIETTGAGEANVWNRSKSRPRCSRAAVCATRIRAMNTTSRAASTTISLTAPPSVTLNLAVTVVEDLKVPPDPLDIGVEGERGLEAGDEDEQGGRGCSASR
jgi:hypothetical protein